MTLRTEHYHLHFDEEQLIDYMYAHGYNDIVIESLTMPNHYYNVVIDGYNDDYNNYYFEYVEHVPYPNKFELREAEDYKEWIKPSKPKDEILQRNVLREIAKYEDDTWVFEKLESGEFVARKNN